MRYDGQHGNRSSQKLRLLERGIGCSGSVIGRAPIVSMPHWGGIIPSDQLDALVVYLKTLK